MVVLKAKRLCSLLSVAVVLSMCVALAGCASSSGQGSSADSSSASSSSSGSSASLAAQAKEGLVFGEETATSLSIVFANETGADIAALSATPVAGEGSVQLMSATETWPAGEKATVHVEPNPDGVFNLSFTIGGSARELHNVDFSRFDEMSVLVQDDVAYITAVLDGAPVHTLEEEYAIAHPPVAEEPVYAEEHYEQPAAVYEEPAATYEEPAAEEAPAQEEDACVRDVILN